MNENIEELLQAARELLNIIKNIPHVPLSSIGSAWERLNKAVKALEAQERGEE